MTTIERNSSSSKSILSISYTYLPAFSPSGMDRALDIVEHYAARYQLKFNANKVKMVVTGSKVDVAFYKDTAHWTINGKKICVVDSNEHLGLIVSGIDEEQRKNIDANIVKFKDALFANLGSERLQ